MTNHFAGQVKVIECHNILNLADRVERLVPFEPNKCPIHYTGAHWDSRSTLMSVSGKTIPQDGWGDAEISDGDTIVMIATPAGDGSGREWLRLAAIFAVAVFSGGIAGALMPAGVTAAAAGTGMTALGAQALIAATTIAVAVTGALLVNALLPSATGEPDDIQDSPTYGIDGAKNTSEEGRVVPVPYGQFRMAGNIISMHTENVEDTQFLYMLINAGEGPIAGITDIELNEQPVTNFQHISLNTRLGEDSQLIIPWFADNVVAEAAGGTGNLTLDDAVWSNHTTDISRPIDRFRLDFVAPQGMIRFNEDGKRRYWTVEFEVEYQLVGAGSWTKLETTVLEDNYVTVYCYFQENTRDPETGEIQTETSGVCQANLKAGDYVTGAIIRNSNGDVVGHTEQQPIYSGTNLNITRRQTSPVRFSVSSPVITEGQYNIRVRRLAPERDDTEKISDQVVWTTTNEIVNDNVTYDFSALLALRIKLDDQMSGVPNVTYINQGRVIKYWKDGAWQTDGPSNNPAWVVYDMMTNDRFGMGIDEARIDIDRFKEWGEYCDAEGLTFNGVFDQSMTAWDALRHVYRAGHARPTNVGTRYSVAIEKPSDPVMMFNSSNMMPDSFEQVWMTWHDRANEVEISYFDETDKYKRRTIKVYDETVANGVPQNTSSFTAYGIVTQDRAVEEAVFQLKQNKYVRSTISFQAPLEAIVCQVGDVIVVQHEQPDWSEGGRLESGSTTTTVELDRTVTIGAGTYKALVHFDSIPVTTGVVSVKSGNKLVLTNYAGEQVTRVNIAGTEHPVLRYDATSVWVEDASSVNVSDSATTYLTDAIVERTITSGAGDHSSVTLSPALPSAPSQYAKWIIGESSVVNSEWRLIDISQDSDFSRTLTAVEYRPEIYDWTSGIGGTVPVDTGHGLSVPHVTNLTLADNKVFISGAYRPLVSASWSPPDDYPEYNGADIYVSINGEGLTLHGSVSASSHIYEFEVDIAEDPDEDGLDEEGNPLGDEVVVQVVAKSVDGRRALRSTAPQQTITVNGDTFAPDDPTAFVLDAVAGGVNLGWTNPSNADLKSIQIWRHTADIPSLANVPTTAELVNVVNKGVKRYQDTTATTVGQDYYYWIRAVDHNGNASNFVVPTPASVQLTSSGTDPITGYLTNEVHTVAADKNGENYGDLSGAGGTYEVYEGATKVTASSTFSFDPTDPDYASVVDETTDWSLTKNGLKLTISKTTGVYTLSAASQTAWNSDAETFKLQSVYSGVTILQSYAITKSKAGQDGSGANAYLIKMIADRQTFTFDNSGTADPVSQTLSLTTKNQNLTNSGTWTAVDELANPVTLTNVNNTATGAAADLTIANFGAAQWVKVTFSITENSTTYSDTITIVRVQDGATGDDAVVYRIVPKYGNAIKEGTGTLVVESHKIEGTGDTVLSSGNIKLYDESNNVVEDPLYDAIGPGSEVANGYVGVLDSSDISGSIILTLKEGVGGVPLDTITLADIYDGEAVGFIELSAPDGTYVRTLGWNKAADGGSWTPTQSKVRVIGRVYKAGAEIASETWDVTLTTGAGTLAAAQIANHGDISVSVTGGGTAALTLEFTHTPTGVKFQEEFSAVQGGSEGSDGLSIAEIYIYRRTTANPPATPTGGTYDFGTQTLDPVPSLWFKDIPSGTDPVWVSVGQASIQGTTGTATPTWSAPAKAFEDGATGADGQSVDMIFKRSGSQPATPSASSGVPAGWYSDVNSVPNEVSPIWSSVGTRPDSGSDWTWQTPIKVEAEASTSDGGTTEDWEVYSDISNYDCYLQFRADFTNNRLYIRPKGGSSGPGTSWAYQYDLEVYGATVTGETAITRNDALTDLTPTLIDWTTDSQGLDVWSSNGVRHGEGVTANSGGTDEYYISLDKLDESVSFRVRLRQNSLSGGTTGTGISLGNRVAVVAPFWTGLDTRDTSITFTPIAGIRLIWKGDLASPPANPLLNWAYYDTTYETSFVWDGDSWEKLAGSPKTNYAGKYASFEGTNFNPIGGGTNTETRLDNTVSKFGGQSMRVESGVADGFAYLTSQTNYDIQIPPNRKWILSGYVYLENTGTPDTGSTNAQILVKTSNANFYSVSGTVPLATWTRIQGAIDLSADSSEALLFRVDNDSYNSAGNTVMYFDGLQLELDDGSGLVSEFSNPVAGDNSGYIYDTGLGYITWPQSATSGTAQSIQFNSSIAGSAVVLVDAWDVDGTSVKVELNGVQFGPLNPLDADFTLTELFVDNLVAGTNTLKIWSTGADVGYVRRVRVMGASTTGFTWIAYADDDSGTNFTTGAAGTRSWIGIARNQSSPIESNSYTDYEWTQLTGDTGPDGFSIVELVIYLRASSSPDTPTGGSYDFGTQTLTPPTNPVTWFNEIPSGTDPVYACVGQASIQGATGTDPSITWSAPVKVFEDGTDGQAVDMIFRRFLDQPATPSPSLGVPSGWYSDVNSVPDSDNIMWSSVGTRPDPSSNWTWQTPIRVEGENATPRNFMSPSSLVVPEADPMGAWDVQGGLGVEMTTTNTLEGPYGAYPVWISIRGNGTTNGGWLSKIENIVDISAGDKDRAWVTYCWFYHRGNGTQADVYMGWWGDLGDNRVEDSGGIKVDNPYFISAQSFNSGVQQSDELYLAVGIVNPTGNGTFSGKSGIYRASDGAQIYSGDEFQFSSQATQHMFRFGVYAPGLDHDSSDGADFLPVGTFQMDGTEPTVEGLLRRIIDQGNLATKNWIDIGYPANASFESGDFTHWVYDVGASVVLDAATARHGSYYAKIPCGSGGPNIRSEYIPVIPGQKYKFQVWAQRDESDLPSDTMDLAVRWYDTNKGAHSTPREAIETATNTAGWQSLEGIVTVPANVYFMRMDLGEASDATTNGYWFVDAARIERGGALSDLDIIELDNQAHITNLLDGANIQEDTIAAKTLVIVDFENLWPDGSMESFATGQDETALAFSGGTADTSVESNGTNAFGGTQYLKFARNDGATHQIYAKKKIAVNPGDEIYYEYQAREDVSGQGAFIRPYIRRYDESLGYITGSTAVPTGTVTTDYTTFTGSYQIPSDTYFIEVGLRRTATTGGGQIWVDNLVIRRMKGGNLIVDGAITADKLSTQLSYSGEYIVDTNGSIHTLNKDSATDTTPGVFIGHDGGSNWDFAVGTSNGTTGEGIIWDGSAGTFTVYGDVIATDNVISDAITETANVTDAAFNNTSANTWQDTTATFLGDNPGNADLALIFFQGTGQTPGGSSNRKLRVEIENVTDSTFDYSGEISGIASTSVELEGTYQYSLNSAKQYRFTIQGESANISTTPGDNEFSDVKITVVTFKR